MEPREKDAGLLIVGISHRTAPVEVREKFSIGESELYPTLHALTQSSGIEEIVALSTCNRTEFIVWASDFGSASASIQGLLAAKRGLHPRHWASFYRLIGEEAILHLFRVASSLDSLVVGEPQIIGQVKTAWTKAQQAGTSGPFLNYAFQKALHVSKRVRNETAIGDTPVSIPYAAVMLGRQIFGSLEHSNVLLIGTGKMSKISARSFAASGVQTIWVTNRTFEHARELAQELGGRAVPFEERWEYLSQSDIIVSSTGCPHMILDRRDAERIRELRDGRPVFLIDIAVPRDIDPAVSKVPGFFLYNIDDLEEVVARNMQGRRCAAAEAEKVVAREIRSFHRQLDSQRVVPVIAAMRARLEELRREELAHYDEASVEGAPPERGALDQFTARLMDRIAGELARELKRTPDPIAQDTLAAAVRRLFCLSRSKSAMRQKEAGASVEPHLVQ